MSAYIYLAAPLFSVGERDLNVQIAAGLTEAGYSVLLPQDIQAPQLPGGGLDMGYVFGQCVELLDRADAVVALVDGSDVDSGTAWELGYAYARGIMSLCVRTDMRSAEAGESTNIMIGRGATRMLHANSYHQTLPGVIGKIVTELGEMIT